VPPGTYQVRLKVGDDEFTESFTIVKDPRQSTGDAELQAQCSLLLHVRDKLTETNEAINGLRRAREQVTSWEERTKETEAAEKVAAAAKTLKAQLDAIEGELIQMKAESSQDTLNFPVKLNTKLAALASAIGNADTAPTTQQEALAADLTARVDAQLERWQQVIAEDIVAFNALIREAALPAVAPV
jgi:seryl-tRNA synthetase